MHDDELCQILPDDILSRDCLWKLLKEFNFNTILDLGAGFGRHSEIFCQQGKHVTAIISDMTQPFDEKLKSKIELIVADFTEYSFPRQFDCIWMSHILEHQRNIGLFLGKVYHNLKDGGILALTVPSFEPNAGGGHVNCFAPGHLIYHLVLSGFDLSDMRLKAYLSIGGGTNLSIICHKNSEFSPSKANFADIALVQCDRQLPAYVMDGINRFKAAHPSPWGGHERIPSDIEYKW